MREYSKKPSLQVLRYQQYAAMRPPGVLMSSRLTSWMGSSPGPSRVGKLRLLLPAVIAGLSALSLLAATPAGAASACYQFWQYAGYRTTYYHNRGIEGDINYEHLEMYLYNNDTDHANLHLNVESIHDPEVDYGTEGWIQTGWTVGYQDKIHNSTTNTYAEVNGPNTGPVPDLTLCPTDTCPWGNRLFDLYWTGATNSAGRGLFYATTTLNDYRLGYAWLLDPTGTKQEAEIEGYSNDSSGYCPAFGSYSLFGTTGNLGSWTNTTELYIYTNDNGGEYKPWTPANIDTAPPVHDGPYVLNTYSNSDAFQAYGGG